MDIRAVKPVSSVPAAPAVPEKPAFVSAAPGHAPPVATERHEPSPDQDMQKRMAAVAEQLREYMKSSDRDLEFSVDGDSGTTVITVRDASTGDVVRQIPNEEALRMIRHLNAQSGTLVDLIA